MSLFKKNTVVENDYKQKYTLEERLVESNRILTKHVDRIPVILSKLVVLIFQKLKNADT